MLSTLFTMGGSGIAGAVFGLISDALHNRSQRRSEELKLQNAREARLQGQVSEYLKSDTGFRAGFSYSFSFWMLTATLCTCCLVFALYPSVEIVTFNPDSSPSKVSFLWGMFSLERKLTKTYSITTGGISYALLHAITFQVGTVMSGIVPMQRNGN